MAPVGLGLAVSLCTSRQKGGEQSPPRLTPWFSLQPPSMGLLQRSSMEVLHVLHPHSWQPLVQRARCLCRPLGALRVLTEAGPQAFLLRRHHQLPSWPPSSPQ